MKDNSFCQLLSLAEMSSVALYHTDVITMHNIFGLPQLQFPFPLNNSPEFCHLLLGEDDSGLYKINKSLITAAFYFEIKSSLYERNQHFESF